MTTQNPNPIATPASRRTLDVELLAIDLSTCGRCRGTLGNVEQAMAEVQRVAALTGTEIRLRTTVIGSEEEARERRFASSPTVRVDGRDLAFETRESQCDACSDLCGCGGGISCRVWSYQGAEHTEAPVGLVVEALLRAIAGAGTDVVTPAGAAEDFVVPENLRRFFAGRQEVAVPAAAPESAAGCCPPEELASCCEPAAKATCCAPPAPATPSAAPSCGCA